MSEPCKPNVRINSPFTLRDAALREPRFALLEAIDAYLKDLDDPIALLRAIDEFEIACRRRSRAVSTDWSRETDAVAANKAAYVAKKKQRSGGA